METQGNNVRDISPIFTNLMLNMLNISILFDARANILTVYEIIELSMTTNYHENQATFSVEISVFFTFRPDRNNSWISDGQSFANVRPYIILPKSL